MEAQVRREAGDGGSSDSEASGDSDSELSQLCSSDFKGMEL